MKILLEELHNRRIHVSVSIRNGESDWSDGLHNSVTGKKVQDVVVADSTISARCSLWEEDIGQLKKGKSYHLQKIANSWSSKIHVLDGEIVPYS